MNISKIFTIWLVTLSVFYYMFENGSNRIWVYYNDIWHDMYEQENYSWAINQFKKWVKFDSNNTVIWYNLGLAQYNIGEFEESLLSSQKALDNKEVNYSSNILKWEINNLIMTNYFNLWDYEKLEKKVDEELNLNSKNLFANYYKAEIQLHNYEYNSALGYINRYLEIDWEYEEALYLKGDILYYMWDYKKSVELFVNTKNYYSAGFASLYSYDFENAVKYFELSLEQEFWESIDSHDDQLIKNIMLAISYYFTKDYNTSNQIFTEVIKQDYQEYKYKVIPFYTLVQHYSRWLTKWWKNYIEGKLNYDTLIEKQSTIDSIFIEKSLDEFKDYLYQNYIYSGME